MKNKKNQMAPVSHNHRVSNKNFLGKKGQGEGGGFRSTPMSGEGGGFSPSFRGPGEGGGF